MCWKWIKELFSEVPMEHSSKLLLSFAINNYPGNENDLQWCVNDQDLVVKKLPEFQARVFQNSEVTKRTFIDEVDKAISQSVTGDVIVIHYSGHGTYIGDSSGDEPDGIDECLYLYDGILKDDDINTSLQKIPEGVTVVVLLDSCFSGTGTRKLWKNGNKGRFHQTDFVAKRKVVKPLFRSPDMKWIAISGCGERQTSAEAVINGSGHGVFTWYAMATLNRSFNYKQWHAEIRKYLPSDDFSQKPELEGPEELLTNQILQ
jgi:hypothetical protein